MLVNNEIDPIRNSSRESDPEMLTRYRQVEWLLKTNLPEARKQYATIKALQLSGQTDEASLAGPEVRRGTEADGASGRGTNTT
jgi:hypothetical protein